jgi:GntR family transcriptional regulator
MLNDRALDRDVPIPLYFQLKQILLSGIKSGAYPVDAAIPTEKELSELFGISRTTVRQAVTELRHEGWLYSVKSKGTFVKAAKIKQDFIKRLESFNEQIARAGGVPSTEVLALKIERATARDAEQFDIPEGEKMVLLWRRRFADGEPIVTVRTLLPIDRCGFVLERDFRRESLYDVLSGRPESRVHRVTRVLEAVAADAEDARLLDIPAGAPVQFSKTIGLNAAGQGVEYSLARYRGDRNRFEVELQIGG